MAHYYAYCERHGKCGPRRSTTIPNARSLAWRDCLIHRQNVSGSHREVYVKLSSRVTSSRGNVYYKYSIIKENE